MRKSYLFLIALIAVSVYSYYFSGCGDGPTEETKPKFYKIGGTVIDGECGSSGEFFRYNQRSPENNPITVVVTNMGSCPIKLITDQPGGTGRVERITVYPDRAYYAEIPEKTGVVTFDMLVRGLMIFSYECGPALDNAECLGKIEVFENFDIPNPEAWRITDSLSAMVSIASGHGCGIYDYYVFEYNNTSNQTQRIKLEAVPNSRPFPERRSIIPFPPQWYGYICNMRFWGFAVPSTGTVMDTIFVNGIPNKTNVDITGRRVFYLKASCLRNLEFPDTTGNLCKGDVKITIEQ